MIIKRTRSPSCHPRNEAIARDAVSSKSVVPNTSRRVESIMYSRSLKVRYVLAALLALICAPVSNASAVIVQFSATISQSPFSSGELAVGGTIAGQYSYDPTAIPFETGPNFARYHLL